MTEQFELYSKENSSRFFETLGKCTDAFMGLVIAFDHAVEILREFNDQWAWVRGSTSAERYHLAGCPYGHHTRGKKRWLLEQKRRQPR
jgi:hypothetical protein